MDSTPTQADRRRAHRRVGAVAGAAFLALLLLGATHGPASADPTVPAIAPVASPQQEVPQQTAPVDPGTALDPDPDGDGGARSHDGYGDGDRDGDGDGGFGGGHRGGGDGGGFPGGGAPGAGAAPAPSTSGGNAT